MVQSYEGLVYFGLNLVQLNQTQTNWLSLQIPRTRHQNIILYRTMLALLVPVQSTSYTLRFHNNNHAQIFKLIFSKSHSLSNLQSIVNSILKSTNACSSTRNRLYTLFDTKWTVSFFFQRHCDKNKISAWNYTITSDIFICDQANPLQPAIPEVDLIMHSFMTQQRRREKKDGRP